MILTPIALRANFVLSFLQREICLRPSLGRILKLGASLLKAANDATGYPFDTERGTNQRHERDELRRMRPDVAAQARVLNGVPH